MASSVEETNEVVCLELPAPSGWKKKVTLFTALSLFSYIYLFVWTVFVFGFLKVYVFMNLLRLFCLSFVLLNRILEPCLILWNCWVLRWDLQNLTICHVGSIKF